MLLRVSGRRGIEHGHERLLSGKLLQGLKFSSVPVAVLREFFLKRTIKLFIHYPSELVRFCPHY